MQKAKQIYIYFLTSHTIPFSLSYPPKPFVCPVNNVLSLSLLGPNWGVRMPPLNLLKLKVADELKSEKLDVENNPKPTAITPESKKKKKKRKVRR